MLVLYSCGALMISTKSSKKATKGERSKILEKNMLARVRKF